jgi:hypothetical protein
MDYKEPTCEMSHYDKMLSFHEWLLIKMNFDRDAMMQKPYNIFEQLDNGLTGSMRKAHALNESQSFLVKTNMDFNNKLDTVEFKFQYHYSPVSQDLQLKAMLASMDSEKRIFMLGRNSSPPTANATYEILDHQRKTKLAKKILKVKPVNTGKRI